MHSSIFAVFAPENILVVNNRGAGRTRNHRGGGVHSVGILKASVLKVNLSSPFCFLIHKVPLKLPVCIRHDVFYHM